MNNADRARRARETLRYYVKAEQGDADWDTTNAITDLLTDLFHLVDQEDLDMQDRVQSALSHYHAELEEEKTSND